MELSDTQWELFDFVKEQHGEQKRKYTGEPYWTHLLSVAAIVSEYSIQNCEVEIALCHDLFEDTPCTPELLEQYLFDLGYDQSSREMILRGVGDLTDKFTKEAYPKFNRKIRKGFEAQRLWKIQPYSQTVKYADIIDNTGSIAANDAGFARVYLRETDAFLWKINAGNKALYTRCCKVFSEAVHKLL
jgi:hypothetical protein